MINKQFFKKINIDDKIFDEIQEEKECVGYYNLPEENTQNILSFAKNMNYKNILVVGIGGSALGAKAVYDFLKYKNKFEKKLYFCESTDPISLSLLHNIDLENTFFIIISKSGLTIETISIFKYILSLVEFNHKQFAIVGDANSPLHKLAAKKELPFFEVPKNVGGRFSVLSNVGLLPLAILGVDIDSLLEGAKTVRDSFFSKKEAYEDIMLKASYYAKNIGKYNINCLFSYSDAFVSFNDWYVQLWGESLGKKQIHSCLNVGLTPIGLLGPTDQHSFLQLIVEGKRDKSVTFIKVQDFGTTLSIPDISIDFLEELDYINGLDFSKLINKQADSIIQSLLNKNDIPLDIIEIEKIDEKSIGELFFYYQLLTSVVAKMLDINAYDQPGVEEGKEILKGFLK